MHAILASFGTDGDVFPYIGLGIRLRERGHRVTLVVPEPYRARAELLGFEFLPIVSQSEINEVLQNPSLWHPYWGGRVMSKWATRFIERQYDQLSNVASDPQSILVANPGVSAARLLQEKQSRRVVSLVLQPGVIPSIDSPPTMPGGLTPPSWLPRPIAQLYWLGVDLAGYALFGLALNKVRKKIGLKPVYRIFQWWLSPDLTIGLFPDWYASPQSDWPASLRLVGFGDFDGSRSLELPDELRKFCEMPGPLISFTTGTGVTHGSGYFRTAVKACQSLGLRGVLLSKNLHQVPRDLPSSIRVCSYAPFRALFPHCAAVVHHGGIGTTAAALASGTSQLILPLAWDQPDNAERVRKLGAGNWLGPRQRTSKHIVRGLNEILNPIVKARCETLAERMKGKDGLVQAVEMLEGIV
ncbi:glycosyltransferase [Telmatocola sphagniphila]|uniref:Glycosyltransferase n=1 Tax=Telmatocola sphagniphila TaxID=1123043 RepID=A0A8E6ETQ3_9BACT|nr:nucleotide disphospho-sugar-binding domain-containing protein [Telmatocola sphagniphila]QVL30400.1 glycosyltransferase [Telmatocola sphagniphila]